jgi:dTDP-4-amino-4,6-dideoxygalactose transaminase
MKDAQIHVTQPELPPLNELIPLLERIWQTRVLTNCGPFHEQLERALCEYLGVEHISLFANGTIALISALQALQVTGEVITSPFSFVATANSLCWNHVKPVFVDIEPSTLNLDPARIEEAVTSRTAAIMPVHCYGNPCDVRSIRTISEKRGLKVIYDAAHAFGVKRAGESVLRHGDLAVLSFHATKVFNTFEGGAIVCHDERMKRRIDSLKNFGLQDEMTVAEPGLNGKMNEFQAALGILQLKTVDQAIAMRKRIDQRYREALAAIEGIECVQPPNQVQGNFSYFPILVRPSYRLGRDALHQRLAERGINARRYFHPLISEFEAYRNLPSAARENLPVATEVARQVLCLPIYPRLDIEDTERVIDVISGG